MTSNAISVAVIRFVPGSVASTASSPDAFAYSVSFIPNCFAVSFIFSTNVASEPDTVSASMTAASLADLMNAALYISRTVYVFALTGTRAMPDVFASFNTFALGLIF